MKHILVDLYKTKNLYSGLGQFSLNFAKTLVQQLPDDLQVDLLVPNDHLGELAGDRVNLVKASAQSRYLPALNKTYDLWHSLHQLPAHAPNKKTPWLLTIHDLNFLVEKQEGKAGKYLAKLQSEVDKSTAVSTISNYTRSVIEEHLELNGKNVHVIHNGVVPPQSGNPARPLYVPDGPFFFSIGIFSPKKNFHLLPEVLKRLPTHNLIMAGTHDNEYGEKIRSIVKDLGMADRVVLPGGISEQDKDWLYGNADALLFPSMAEGFGLPAVEAMHAGKPVFLSRQGALMEVGGENAFYFEDEEPAHMAQVIREGLATVKDNLHDFKIAQKQRASEFSWTRCVDAYLELYKSFLA